MKRVSYIVLSILLLASVLTLSLNTQDVNADETIYIRADGSVEPSTTPISNLDNVTYTFTDNINDPLVIERDNIVVDGDGHATQGIGTGTGIGLSYRSNVTLKNLVITQFGFGISLNHSANCAIVGNIMMENSFEAIRLYESLSNNIASNDINATDYDGIVLYGSSDNKIDENNLTDNYDGIRLYESSKNDITENIVTNNYYGIFLAFSSNNSLFHNNISTNDGNGVSLAWSSSENRIVENHIEANEWCGIYLNASSNNTIYHNRFVDNAPQTSVNDSANIWSEGYPSGGNYWSDYAGVDSNHDGIGDTVHVIDGNNTDRYPLMGMFSDFNATLEHHIQTICNSTVYDFEFNGTAISFSVSAENGTTGFCRICIPTALMNSTYAVFVNGTEVQYDLLLFSNSTHNYLYFAYSHSTQEVIVVPEFPSATILTVFMALTLLATALIRKKRTRRLG